jgi:hypothetical protein
VDIGYESDKFVFLSAMPHLPVHPFGRECSVVPTALDGWRLDDVASDRKTLAPGRRLRLANWEPRYRRGGAFSVSMVSGTQLTIPYTWKVVSHDKDMVRPGGPYQLSHLS